MRKLSLFLGILAIAAFTGCQDGVVDSGNEAALSSEATQSSDVLSKVGKGYIWADGTLFATIGTPTLFDPIHGPTDKLFHGNFKNGIGAISDSKPGDQDWNGGRWEIWDPNGDLGDKYDDADSYEDLDENDFHPTGTYLECPLISTNGHGPM